MEAGAAASAESIEFMRKTNAGRRNDALRAIAARRDLPRPETAIHAIWSTPMSTTFSATSTFGAGPARRSGGALHQPISWRAVAAPWRLALLWAARRSQRQTLAALVEEA